MSKQVNRMIIKQAEKLGQTGKQGRQYQNTMKHGQNRTLTIFWFSVGFSFDQPEQGHFG